VTHMTSFSEVWPARFLSVLRIVSGLLFTQHGAQKLFGLFATPQMHSVPLFSFMGLGGALEFFGSSSCLVFSPGSWPPSWQAKWPWPISCSTRRRVFGR